MAQLVFIQRNSGLRRFILNDKEVFLNGINQAWIDYGNDFGNGQTNGKFCALQKTLQDTKAAGGHAMRIWLHVTEDGLRTPSDSRSIFVCHGRKRSWESTTQSAGEMSKRLQ